MSLTVTCVAVMWRTKIRSTLFLPKLGRKARCQIPEVVLYDLLPHLRCPRPCCAWPELNKTAKHAIGFIVAWWRRFRESFYVTGFESACAHVFDRLLLGPWTASVLGCAAKFALQSETMFRGRFLPRQTSVDPALRGIKIALLALQEWPSGAACLRRDRW